MKSPFKLLSVLCLLSLGSLLHAADLSITAANFKLGDVAQGKAQIGTAGAVLTVGQLIYLDDASQTWLLADSNGSAAASNVGAIVVSPAASIGSRFLYSTADVDLTLGATMSVTAPAGIYVLSATAGAICPASDLATGCRPIPVLVVKSTTKCIFNPMAFRSLLQLSWNYGSDYSNYLASLSVSPSERLEVTAFTRPRALAFLRPNRRASAVLPPWHRAYSALAA